MVPSPTVVRPEEGSHPRPSENVSCSTRPNQNTGSASPANDSADETRSGQRQRVSAGVMPSGAAAIIARSSDAETSSSVAGTRSQTRTSTGRPSL